MCYVCLQDPWPSQPPVADLACYHPPSSAPCNPHPGESLVLHAAVLLGPPTSDSPPSGGHGFCSCLCHHLGLLFFLTEAITVVSSQFPISPLPSPSFYFCRRLIAMLAPPGPRLLPKPLDSFPWPRIKISFLGFRAFPSGPTVSGWGASGDAGEGLDSHDSF